MSIDSSTPIGAARAVGAIDVRLARQAAGETPVRRGPAPTALAVRAAQALEAGPPPVDSERIDAIRKAVESGSYPLVPAKVADAIIAAGMLLRSPK